MKKLIILIALGLASLKGESQDNYIEYYNLVNQAGRSLYEKNLNQSLDFYLQGFQKVSYVHAFHFAKAARVAVKLKKYELANDFIINAIKRGYPARLIDRKEFKGYRKSKYFKELEIEQLIQFSEDSVDQLFKLEIDSLHFIDQNILRGNKNVKGFQKDPTLEYSDSLNFLCLLNLIEKNGFPSERKIGYKGYGKAWVIIHHNVRLPKNHQYLPMLLEALKAGDYQPENYCWIIDQGRQIKGEPLLYYHWDVVKDLKSLSESKKRDIDIERRKVGMPYIDRMEVVTKKGKVRNKVNW